ncbi:hypothetical protein H5410_055156 [Solanum commersonii]|uniref:Uncharacterized protein n=1 Tax=Solanum commersonii TaxID=4109 RepID=A0A9J5WJI6_SOLCO|nr:hypothetical protein H5410_055156 [Solanum commersonii]
MSSLFRWATLKMMEAYDSFDPNGNITVKWDVSDWLPDGYVELRTINRSSANCCKGGVISSLVQDGGKAISSFQLSVGGAGTTNRTTPGPGYTCGLAKIVEPSKFVSEDGRRVTQAMSKIHFSFISSSAFDLERHMHILTVPIELKKLLHAVSPSQPSKRTPLYHVPKMQLWLPQDQWKLCRSRRTTASFRLWKRSQQFSYGWVHKSYVHWHVKFNYKEYWRHELLRMSPFGLFHFSLHASDSNLPLQSGKRS